MLSNFVADLSFDTNGYNYVHLHPCHEIILILTDNTDVLFESLNMTANKGDLFIIHPYMFHKLTSPNTLETAYIWFDEHNILEQSPVMKNLLNYFSVNNIFRFHIPDEHLTDMTQLFVDAYNIFKETDAFLYDFLNVSHLGKILCRLIDIHKEYPESVATTYHQIPKNSDRITYSILQFITDNIDKNISTELITKKFAISKTSLYWLMKNTTGMSLKQFTIQLKLSRASELLSQGKSVTDTANALGFASYANFIKLFKQKTGVSPYKYGKNLKQFIESENSQETLDKQE